MNEMKNNYDRLGFVVSDRQIIPDEMIRLGLEGVYDALAGVFDTGIPPHAHSWTVGEPLAGLCEMNGAHVCSTKIRELCFFKPMIDFMAEACGAKSIKLLTSQMFYKCPPSTLPYRKKTILYHQDNSYAKGCFAKSHMVSCWIPLTNMSKENGSLEFVVNSHHMGLSSRGGIEYDRLDINEGMFKAHGCYRETVVVPKGYLSVHHGDIYHGSAENLTNEPRVAVVLHCLKDDFTQIKEMGQGVKMDDPFLCPVLL